MIGALLGAGASIYGAKLGADASNNAAAYNHQIDMLNYIQRERERFDSINQARKADTENKLGTTDAQGNRSYFKPGVGWVTELADDQQALQELYEREETEQLNNDLQKQRGVFNDNIERQGDENVLADALLREFTGHVRDDPRNIEGMTNNASVKGITEGFEALRAAVRNVNRLNASRPFSVTAGPAFTAKWLAPRIYRFVEQHPDIEIRFTASLKRMNFETDDVDAAIRFSRMDEEPGCYVETLIEELMAPPCTPAFSWTAVESISRSPIPMAEIGCRPSMV